MNQQPETPAQQTKRDFLKIILSGGVFAFLGAVLYPILEYLIPPKQADVEVSSVKAGKLSEIEKDSGKIIKFGTKPVILIRTTEGDLRAFSATCNISIAQCNTGKIMARSGALVTMENTIYTAETSPVHRRVRSMSSGLWSRATTF